MDDTLEEQITRVRQTRQVILLTIKLQLAIAEAVHEVQQATMYTVASHLVLTLQSAGATHDQAMDTINSLFVAQGATNR